MSPLYEKKQIHLYSSIYSKKNANIPTLLIQLTKSDNIPEHFWRTFTVEFYVWDMEFSIRSHQRAFPTSKEALDEYFGTLSDIFHNNPLLLIILNSHLITDPAILLFLNKLNAFKIDDLHIILMSETLPALSLQNETFSNDLSNLRYYLSPEEEARFYEIHDLQINKQALLQIRHFTDGWPAAATAIVEMESLFGKSFLHAPDDHISSWLEHSFFKQYTQSEMKFLIQLYLIDHFELELVQDLLNWKSDILEYFFLKSPIIRYQAQTRKYCFSPYIAPLLDKYLILLSQEQKDTFYICAGDWYRSHNYPIRAIYCYQKAGDYYRLLDIMKNFALPSNLEAASRYTSAIEDIPSDFVEKHPYIYIIQTLILCILYRYDDAYTLLCSFITRYDNPRKMPDDLRKIVGEAYVIHIYLSIILFKNIESIAFSETRTMELLPDAPSIFSRNINIFADVPAFNLLTPEPGAAQKCLYLYERSEPLFRRITGAADNSWCRLLASAELDYYTRNFDEIELKIRKIIHTALTDMRWDAVCSACFLKMRYNLAKGNYNKMMESKTQLHYYADKADYHSFFSMPDLADSWLALKLGNKHQTADWIREETLYRQKISPWNYGRGDLLHCYYLLENQMYETMLDYIETCSNLFMKKNYNIMNIYLSVFKMIGQYKLHLYTDLITLMEDVYKWCSPNRIIMPLIEFGSNIKPVINYCLNSNECHIPSDWLHKINKKATSYYTYQYHIRREAERAQSTAESPLTALTVSEQKLLYHISHGATIQELSHILHVSNTTVKGMTQRIYKKLNARNKTDASRIAGEYHLDQLIENP